MRGPAAAGPEPDPATPRVLGQNREHPREHDLTRHRPIRLYHAPTWGEGPPPTWRHGYGAQPGFPHSSGPYGNQARGGAGNQAQDPALFAHFEPTAAYDHNMANSTRLTALERAPEGRGGALP